MRAEELVSPCFGAKAPVADQPRATGVSFRFPFNLHALSFLLRPPTWRPMRRDYQGQPRVVKGLEGQSGRDASDEVSRKCQ